MASDEAEPGLTVWHDGGCPLCRREIALMRRLDRSGRIVFVDATEAALEPSERNRLLSRFHAREADGPMLDGAAAFAAMWRQVPLLRPLGLAARWPPALAVLEWLYGGFLRFRPALQRLARGAEQGIARRGRP